MNKLLKPERLRAALETLTGAAVLFMIGLVINILVWSYLVPSPNARFISGLQKGGKLELPARVNTKNASQTLLIVISPECGYCNASMPFYRQLMAGERNVTDGRVIFVGREAAIREFLSRDQLNAEVVSLAEFNLNALEDTPTIVLVDADGEILDFWAGRLSVEHERQILAAFTSANNS